MVVGFIPMALLFPAGYALAGLWPEIFDSGVLFALPLLFLVVALTQLAAGYIRSVMRGWKVHADSLLAEDRKVDLRELYGLRGLLVTYVLVVAAVQIVFVSYVLPQSNTVLQNMLISLPFLYWNFYLDTVFWMFAFSIYKIYRTGKLPMKLMSFTEDRTLGLKPFGRASLQLIATFFIFLFMILFAQILTVGISTAVMALIIGVALVGLGLFFVPLVSLHGKLVSAKAEAYAWITPQHTALMELVRRIGVKNTGEGVLGQLAAVEGIRRDIGQIHSWPFDVGIVVRLSAIVLSVVAILLSALLRDAFGI